MWLNMWDSEQVCNGGYSSIYLIYILQIRSVLEALVKHCNVTQLGFLKTVCYKWLYKWTNEKIDEQTDDCMYGQINNGMDQWFV